MLEQQMKGTFDVYIYILNLIGIGSISEFY